MSKWEFHKQIINLLRLKLLFSQIKRLFIYIHVLHLKSCYHIIGLSFYTNVTMNGFYIIPLITSYNTAILLPGFLITSFSLVTHENFMKILYHQFFLCCITVNLILDHPNISCLMGNVLLLRIMNRSN